MKINTSRPSVRLNPRTLEVVVNTTSIYQLTTSLTDRPTNKKGGSRGSSMSKSSRKADKQENNIDKIDFDSRICGLPGCKLQ